jgi:hypothetical protein
MMLVKDTIWDMSGVKTTELLHDYIYTLEQRDSFEQTKRRYTPYTPFLNTLGVLICRRSFHDYSVLKLK